MVYQENPECRNGDEKEEGAEGILRRGGGGEKGKEKRRRKKAEEEEEAVVTAETFRYATANGRSESHINGVMQTVSC